MKEKSTYKPIACSFHDILLHHATLQDEVTLRYIENDKAKEVKVRLLDVVTKSGEEFVILSNGERVRLDFVVSVNEEVLSRYC